jgi:CubicO group peptidase (beta-lactamase class C family)
MLDTLAQDPGSARRNPMARIAIALLTLNASLLLAQDDTQRRIEKIEACLPSPVTVATTKDASPECHPLLKRMAELHVNAVSIAVVHNGILEWDKGYGPGTNPQTLFQAGSISKPLAALAALRLVQQGKLQLDSDVNTDLTSWKIPSSPAAPNAVVTLRELLTHTAGFTVHGFPGYASNEPVPTLVQVLNGTPPANTAPIRLESVPGEKWNYSGGGYTVMQQLLIDVTHLPFPKLLHDTVLQPIGMLHSTYEQPLPDSRKSIIALPYRSDGTPVPGGPHTYPEMAAAGLWTTPSDLATYIVEIQKSLDGRANHLLSKDLTNQMLTPGKGKWGLGLQIGGSPTQPYFSHGGVNEGYESLFVAYEHTGDGAVVMTNAEGGSRLAAEVMSSIAVAYNWPDFRPAIRTEIRLDRKILARYVGTYQITPTFSIAVTLEGDQLMTQATGQSQEPIYAESPTKFFLKIVDAEIDFVQDDKGNVTHMILHQGGRDMKGVKK